MSFRSERDLRVFGDNVLRWRKLSGLTAQMVAERAGVTRNTLRAIETGAGTAQLGNVFAVLHVLGVTEKMLDATEPLNTDLGRINADRMLPQRVVPKRAGR